MLMVGFRSMSWRLRADPVLGRTFTIMPSGFHDIDEEPVAGYGGKNLVDVLEKDGVMDALRASAKR